MPQIIHILKHPSSILILGLDVPAITMNKYLNHVMIPHDHYFSSKSLFICLCLCMIQAHGERETIARRKKETLRKEKVGRSGESKNQSTGNAFYVLYTFCLTLTGKRVKQTSELDCDT